MLHHTDSVALFVLTTSCHVIPPCLSPAVAGDGDVSMCVPRLVPLLPPCVLCSSNTVLSFWQEEDDAAKTRGQVLGVEKLRHLPRRTQRKGKTRDSRVKIQVDISSIP